jgi:hypothetical protein
MTTCPAMRFLLISVLGFGLAAACILPLRAQAPKGVALPSAKEIVARYEQALGGEAAIRRHTSITMRGTLEFHGLSLPFAYYAAAPYRRIEKVALPNNLGDTLNGYDGDLAWAYDPRTGAQIIAGNDHESAKRDADFYYPLDELSWFKSMETVGIEDFEGRPCYRLHGINNWDQSNDHLYDVETGLLTSYEFESDTGNGMALTHEIFSDYRPVDGVLFPMKQAVKIKPKGASDWTVFLTLTYTSVTTNDVDPAVFAPPQSVRDLAAKQK